MGIKFSVHTEGFDEVHEAIANACTEAEHVLAEQIERDTQPFVPFRTGSLNERTRVVGNSIIYPGPYARYLYNGKVWVDPKINAAGFLTDDGWKSRVGVKKVETNRNLVFYKAPGHRQAQAHWCEASKAQNLDKWLRVAEKAVKKYGTD